MLKKLQTEFYQDVLNPDQAHNYLSSGNFSGSDLINIYHNNYFSNLTGALSSTYSCVKRLVGDDFFLMLATQFIRANASKTANLVDYGEGFCEFIEQHEQCQGLPYLADVAKFERFYERCYFSINDKFLMQSKYPIIKIWQLDENSEQLDFNAAGIYLKISKKGGKVVVERLTKQEYDHEQNN